MLGEFKKSASFATALEKWVNQKYGSTFDISGDSRLFWLSTTPEFRGPTMEFLSSYRVVRDMLIGCGISKDESMRGYPNVTIYDVEKFLDGDDCEVSIDAVINDSYRSS